ncbi:MAG: DUF802 domain-containing protein [Marinobacter sp.]|nr:DUF802 domain-containing protein [Marinobacter sp.]
MTRLFFFLAFALGLAVVAWIGHGFLGSDRLALTVTAIIAAVYGLGFAELIGFRRTTHQLAERLRSAPDNREQIGRWLSGLPEPVQFAVQKRLDGHSAALPSPQLTPYLVGLLVMLGLLGTFAGMIVTLNGAATALDGSTELSAIRSALAAPIAGLSLAFGTSIAGVAASAMLGLASTLSRRERLQVSRQLDTTLRQKLHHLSADYQRQQAFQALESQARALPDMASAMAAMTTRMEQLGQTLEQSLTRNQQEFHSTVGSHYQTLADSVAQSLASALDASTRLAAERVEPIVEKAMTGLRDEAGELHRSWSDTTQRQLTNIAEAFRTITKDAGERWQQNLATQQAASEQNALRWQENLDTLIDRISEQLTALRDQEATRGEAATDRLAQLEKTVSDHLTQLGTGLEAPMTRLIETASETPKAAAEVINQLQQEMTRNSERENQLLAERQRLVEELDSLLESQRSNADSQRHAVDTLISGAGDTLTGISERFNALIEEQSQQLGKLGDDITGSSQEVGALSEAFQQAVALFSTSNSSLQETLTTIQKAMDNASSRHDEQLAYYVAQAREVIDLSVSSQKDVIDAVTALRKGQPETAGAN